MVAHITKGFFLTLTTLLNTTCVFCVFSRKNNKRADLLTKESVFVDTLFASFCFFWTFTQSLFLINPNPASSSHLVIVISTSISL